MSRATVAGSPSSESAAPDGLPPARQSRPTLIDATRQSMLLPTLHPATMMLALTAASSHPDCRAVLTQIVALHQHLGVDRHTDMLHSRHCRHVSTAQQRTRKIDLRQHG